MDTDGDWHEAGDGNLGKLSDVEEDTPELLETVQEVQDLTGGNPSGNEDPAAEPGDLDSLNNDEYFRLQGIKTWPTTPPTTNMRDSWSGRPSTTAAGSSQQSKSSERRTPTWSLLPRRLTRHNTSGTRNWRRSQ